MTFLKNFFLDLRDDKVHAFAFFFSIFLFVWVGFFKNNEADVFDAAQNENIVELYHTNGCPHCHAAIEFVEQTLKTEFPDKKIITMELSQISDAKRVDFMKFSTENNIKGVPVFKYKDKYVEGFEKGKDEPNYRALLNGTLEANKKGAVCAIGDEGGCDQAETSVEITAEDIAKLMGGESVKKETARPSRIVKLPVFGEIDVFQESIPFLAVVLGLVDGFNPCAMWVLVFMISVIVDLNDKRKIFVIVGSFLAASAVFYFALMAGWINLFKVIGYIRLLTVGIGAIAVYTGFESLKSFFEGPRCKVTSAEGRNRIKARIKALAEKPLSWGTLTGVFALAIVVNGIEFVCSAALPAIFTSVLAFSHLSTLMHYFYISVYMLFFMLDDIIVFSLAAFAVNKYAGDKYMVWCKLFGGLILFALGFVMLFHPDWLS
ncbi:MAG: hypothetical protein MJ247_06625 [Alphaproteobacteria bacterium]|nr:hypothetical protein [Alphaproteobacteria bacterium]